MPAPPFWALSSEPQMRNTPMRFARMRKRKYSGKLWTTSGDISAILKMMTTAGDFSFSLFAFSGNGSRRSRAVSYSFEVEFTHKWD